MRRGFAFALAAVVLATAGCGGGDDEAATPAACLAGPDAYLAALRDAPGEVRLRGETPISECIVPEQEGGELGSVGETVIEAATRLNRDARSDPAGDAAIQLGYLAGAVERGASGTSGIHADLVLRLEAAARFAPGGDATAPRVERDYERGYAAGQDSG